MRLPRHGVAGLSATGKSHASANRPDFRLAQITLDQRTADVALAGGLSARPVVVEIVAVATVGQHGQPEPPGRLFHPVDQFFLAMVTAVGPVGLISGIGQLVGRDDFVPDADVPHNADSLIQLALGQGGTAPRDGRRSIAQRQMGRLGQHGISKPPENAAGEELPYPRSNASNRSRLAASSGDNSILSWAMTGLPVRRFSLFFLEAACDECDYMLAPPFLGVLDAFVQILAAFLILSVAAGDFLEKRKRSFLNDNVGIAESGLDQNVHALATVPFFDRPKR